MNEPVHSKRVGWSAVTAIAAVILLAGYVGSYFALTEKTYLWTHSATRQCPFPWMARLYKPLAVIEEAITGDDVSVR